MNKTSKNTKIKSKDYKDGYQEQRKEVRIDIKYN